MLSSKAASNFLLATTCTDRNVLMHYSCTFFLLGSLSRQNVFIPYGWLHPKIKPCLVGEIVRGLLTLLQQCPTLTVGSKNYSDLSPRSSTGVGILSDEMTRGADLPLPNPSNSSVWFHLTIRRCAKAIYHPSVDPQRWTQMTWWECSHHSSSLCIVDQIERWFSLWVGDGKKVSLLPKLGVAHNTSSILATIANFSPLAPTPFRMCSRRSSNGLILSAYAWFYPSCTIFCHYQRGLANVIQKMIA